MPPQLDLSPSVGHRHLLEDAPYQLAYRGTAFKPWQSKVRKKLRELLAVPINAHEPLEVRSVWQRREKLGTIEKILFRAERDVDVPAYWCVPHAPMKPAATFICLQGHSSGMHLSIGFDRETENTPIEARGDRDFAIGCMRRGVAALCIEQRSFGTRQEVTQLHRFKHNGCHDAVGRALLLGRTICGERVFDVERGLDYLASRGDVDMTRIGILGQSSGGTTSMYAAALLPQIAYCMPSCSTARFADSIATIHHCGCNIVPGIMQWMDMGDVLGAIAPRPLVIINGKMDDIFPIASAKDSFKQAKRAYTAAGAANRVKFVEGPGGHDFYAELGWQQMLKMM